ncbi:nucleotidyltransferase family protein [Candidatus Woesearchaeota archaeon]|nr:MAG: nucleotidyltransferase family protein [Candidatus Woesearchaeota archaeon]
MKQKIAISLDESLLKLVDSKVDGSIIRSRSQAIEYYLNKGIKEASVTTAIILLKAAYHPKALAVVKGKTVQRHQIDFLKSKGIKKILIVTQHSKLMNKLLEESHDKDIPVEILERKADTNMEALNLIRDNIEQENFLVLAGGIFVEFDLANMVKKHLQHDKLVTMGLMVRQNPQNFGNVEMSGDLIVKFIEKPKNPVSNIVNAGFYIFKPETFELFTKGSFERDLFPKLAKIKQLVGFFSYGEDIHL